VQAERRPRIVFKAGHVLDAFSQFGSSGAWPAPISKRCSPRFERSNAKAASARESSSAKRMWSNTNFQGRSFAIATGGRERHPSKVADLPGQSTAVHSMGVRKNCLLVGTTIKQRCLSAGKHKPLFVTDYPLAASKEMLTNIHHIYA